MCHFSHRSFDSSFGRCLKPVGLRHRATHYPKRVVESDDIARVGKPTSRPRHPGMVGSPLPLACFAESRTGCPPPAGT